MVSVFQQDVAVFFNFEIHLLICVVLIALRIVLVTFDRVYRFFSFIFMPDLYGSLFFYLLFYKSQHTHTHTVPHMKA